MLADVVTRYEAAIQHFWGAGSEAQAAMLNAAISGAREVLT